MKKTITTLLLAGVLATLMFGCNVTATVPEVYEYNIELGTEYTFSAVEVFDITYHEATYYEANAEDLAALDTKTPGVYEVRVSSKEKDYVVKYTVADTQMPMLTEKSNYIFTNDITKVDLSTMYEYKDASACTEKLTRFEKISDLKILKDEDAKAMADGLIAKTVAQLLEKQDASVNGEGIYSAVYEITDAAGNVNAREVVVIYDTTAPDVNGIDKIETVVEVEDLNAEWTKTFAEKVTFTDTVDGVILGDKIAVEMTKSNAEKHEYTVKVSTTDRAGNSVSETYTFALVEKEKPAPTPSQPETPSNPTTGNDGASGTGGTTETPSAPTPTPEPEKPQYSYEDKNGDGWADLPDYTEMGGMLVYTRNVSTGYAKFQKKLSEAGMYKVMEYDNPNDSSNDISYFVLCPATEEKAGKKFLDDWLWEHGYQWESMVRIVWTKDEDVIGWQCYNYHEITEADRLDKEYWGN